VDDVILFYLLRELEYDMIKTSYKTGYKLRNIKMLLLLNIPNGNRKWRYFSEITPFPVRKSWENTCTHRGCLGSYHNTLPNIQMRWEGEFN